MANVQQPITDDKGNPQQPASDDKGNPRQPISDDQEFAGLVEKASLIKQQFVDPRLNWYKKHTGVPRTLFCTAAVLTILMSVVLPAIAATAASSFPNKDVVVSGLSVGIAALTGVSSFFRWERTWRGNRTAQGAIEGLCAKWELELVNARFLVQKGERARHVYLATDDLIANVRSVTSSETEGFFAQMQFPQAEDVRSLVLKLADKGGTTEGGKVTEEPRKPGPGGTKQPN